MTTNVTIKTVDWPVEVITHDEGSETPVEHVVMPHDEYTFCIYDTKRCMSIRELPVPEEKEEEDGQPE